MPHLVHHHLFDDLIEELVDDLLGLSGQHRPSYAHLMLHALRVVTGVMSALAKSSTRRLAERRDVRPAQRLLLPIARGTLPLRMLLNECPQGRVVELSRHSRRRQHHLRFVLIETNHRVIKNDVGIVNLPGEGVGAMRPHREPRPGDDPTEEAVAHVLRIEILPFVVIVLLADHHGVDKTDLLEGFVPFGDAVVNRATILHRHGFLDVEDNRLLRGA